MGLGLVDMLQLCMTFACITLTQFDLGNVQPLIEDKNGEPTFGDVLKPKEKGLTIFRGMKDRKAEKLGRSEE